VLITQSGKLTTLHSSPSGIMKAASCILLCLSLTADSLSQDPTADTVKALVRKMVNATAEGDYKTVIEMTHPKLVEMMGGKEKALSEVGKAMEMIKNAGMVFTVKEIDTPTLAKKKNELYSVTTYGMQIRGRGKKITLKSAIVGVSSDGGKAWKFINLDKEGEQGVRDMMPDLPKELKIPKQEQKVEDDK
jgi:hypothetical protein